jgi:uncharacterized protein (TIGR00661 family)
MRILYGANSQGQGHFSKAAVLVPLLEARGHDVRVISSGPTPPAGYHFRWHRHHDGLPYALHEGRTDYGKTLRQWITALPAVWRSLDRVRRLVQAWRPELVISDFEPLTASPFIAPGCEVIALSRQVALFDRAIPLPPDKGLDRKLTRTIIRLFTCGADRLYGYHYEPASFRCVPPVLRPELFRLRPERQQHVLVYAHNHAAADLIDWSRRNRQPVRAYGYPEVARGRCGLVDFRPSSRAALLEDLRTCTAVMTNAGLTTPIEAVVLGKPVCVVPIASQWEQAVNAFHLAAAGLAETCDTWDLDRLLDQPMTLRHRLQSWLTTPPDILLDQLLDERRAVVNQAIAA